MPQTDIFRNFALVIELDRHLEILLLSNDCVIVPDFGGFMAHHVDARKDGTDGTFLPPSRTIGFNPKLTINDSLLAQSYVECYDISYPEALRRIGDEVRELRQHVENDGVYDLHGIGQVRLNDEGHYLFEPCEAGVLTPSLYGLSGYDFKLLSELRENQRLQDAPRFEISGVSPSMSASEMTASTDCPVQEETMPNHRIVALWRTVAAASVAMLMFLLYPSSLDNNNKLVVAQSLNVELLQRILPQTETKGFGDGICEAKPGHMQAVSVAKKASDLQKDTPSDESYVVVLASRVSKANAQEYVDKLRSKGYVEARVTLDSRNTKVVYGGYATSAEASQALKNLRKNEEFADAWILKNQK